MADMDITTRRAVRALWGVVIVPAVGIACAVVYLIVQAVA